jgi:4-amino-4-deoxy-L-arabinose transferase-like glycosyltransferase
LGSWILGWTHHLLDPAPDDLQVVSITAARFAAAAALGLTALLVGLATLRMEGPVAGTVAASAVVLVPRMFAHGQLAGLDALTALMFVSAVFAVIHADGRGGRWWQFALAGSVWGLAMLTRLHGLLLVPPVIAWLLWRRRSGALVPVSSWIAAGMVTFFAGWPWLWLNPIAHLKLFLTTSTARPVLHVFYAARVWPDRDAPWHYPIVMFLVTLPLGLLLLGVAGLWARRRLKEADPGFPLVLGALLVVLAVFAWPGTPVYDGVRLFLMAFPLWAVFVGIGARWLVEHRGWKRTSQRWRLVALGLFVIIQGIGIVVYRRCPLSHYSLPVGGLAGAERLGFEVTYWGDAVDESFLAQAARITRGQSVLFGPQLARNQAAAVWLASPALMEAEVRLLGWDSNWVRPPPGCRFGVFYQRKADLAAVPSELIGSKVVFEHRVQGVWLVRLVEFASRD